MVCRWCVEKTKEIEFDQEKKDVEQRDSVHKIK